MSTETSDTQAILALEYLISKGEVLIRKSPVGEDGIQCVWEPQREIRISSIAPSVSEAVRATAQELQEKYWRPME